MLCLQNLFNLCFVSLFKFSVIALLTVGIVLGVIGGNAFATQVKSSLIFPWDWAIIGLVVCSAIGIGFGLYPAYKASKLNPVEALRFE